MIGPFSYLDLGLIALMVLSAILAMYRGFVREMLAVLSWAVAGLAVAYFVLSQRKFAQDIADQMHFDIKIAQIAVGAIIFLVVLIIVHLLTARISDAVLDSRIGLVDRILGFIFGLARAFVIVVILYMFYDAFFPKREERFAWVNDSLTLPYIQGTGESIKAVLLLHLPPSLMEPSGGATQQGLFLPGDVRQDALA